MISKKEEYDEQNKSNLTNPSNNPLLDSFFKKPNNFSSPSKELPKTLLSSTSEENIEKFNQRGGERVGERGATSTNQWLLIFRIR